MSDPKKTIWTRHFPFLRSLFTLRMLRCYLFVVLCLATLIALFYAEEDLRGKFAWQSCMRQSKAKGIDLDWRTYVPPPVPDDQNFALTPLFASFFDYEYTPTNTHWHDTNIWTRMQRISVDSGAGKEDVPHLGDWTKGHSIDLMAWQTYYRRTKFLQPDGSWADCPMPPQLQDPAKDVLLALSRLDVDLAQLRLASARPQSRFPIHYDELPKAIIPHLAFLKNLSKILQLRAVAELQSERSPDAFADVNLAFYCADALKSESFEISQLVRWQMIGANLQPVWEGLHEHRWSDDQLRAFQRYFSKTDLLSEYDRSTKAGLAYLCGWLESLADDPSTYGFADNGPSVQGPLEAALDSRILPRGWFYQNELSASRFFQDDWVPDVALQTQRVYPGLSKTNSQLFEILPRTRDNFAFKQLAIVVSPQVPAHSQTDINLALIACALERYRIAHGHYPDNLDALSPEFLEKLPHDLINGQPLKYRLSSDSDGTYVLYSIGWNEKDDGGTFPVTGPSNNRGFRDLFRSHEETGDWVWQYPAKN